MSQTSHRTQDQRLSKLYIELLNLSTTLQTSSLLRSFHQTPHTLHYHIFLLPHLPLLLTTQKQLGLLNLRRACVSITHQLFSSVAKETIQERYTNFGRALLWAIDHAENLLSYEQACITDEFEVVKSVSTIFHLVERLCKQEWGILQEDSEDIHRITGNSPIPVAPSKQDPVFQPRKKVKRQKSPSNHPHVVESLQQLSQFQHCAPDSTQTQSEVPPSSSPCIRNDDDPMISSLCMRETTNGCYVPFEIFLNDCENDINACVGHPTLRAQVSYPDKTRSEFIPVEDIHLHTFSEIDGTLETDDASATVVVEMSSSVYETIINLSRRALLKKFPETPHVPETPHAFLLDTDQSLPSKPKLLKMPMTSDCFLRVVQGNQTMEYSLKLFLAVFPYDLCGVGLLKIEFVNGLEAEGMGIVFSFGGMIAVRN